MDRLCKSSCKAIVLIFKVIHDIHIVRSIQLNFTEYIAYFPIKMTKVNMTWGQFWTCRYHHRLGAPKATWCKTVMTECQLSVRTENLCKLCDKASNVVRWKAFCCNLSSS